VVKTVLKVGKAYFYSYVGGKNFIRVFHLQAGNSVGKAKITPVPYLLGLLPLLYPCNYMLETNLHAAWVLIMYLKMVKFGWR